ncbi:MAG: glycoside hydrolase family 130 protein, partial [Isosphaeraceae bacterium]
KYAMGAFLLDLNDPSRLIGRLEEPLLEPNANEREGYVPNVVYSCGGVIHNSELIIPYAMSDYASTFATIRIDTILGAMVRG